MWDHLTQTQNVSNDQLCQPVRRAILLSKTVMDKNLVTKLDVNENVVYEHLNLQRQLNLTFN